MSEDDVMMGRPVYIKMKIAHIDEIGTEYGGIEEYLVTASCGLQAVICWFQECDPPKVGETVEIRIAYTDDE